MSVMIMLKTIIDVRNYLIFTYFVFFVHYFSQDNLKNIDKRSEKAQKYIFNVSIKNL